MVKSKLIVCRVRFRPMIANARVRQIAGRLVDQRSHRVVFLSHCLLNANTRYLGGAACGGANRELVQQCLDANIGIVQLPCPEEGAWGGVLKRRMLAVYGRPAFEALVPVAEAYTRRVYRRLARKVVAQLADCLASGIEVIAIVGIDGSPSCGARVTIDLGGAARAMAATQVDSLTTARQNEIVREHARPGRGLFIDELERAMRRRGVRVPVLAHDLFAELDGKPSTLRLC
ncbi:MAG: DUF523 domain-containing protein [Myxococcaceae bacterium]|nr:DUF523 domain-containing protein [Myxococcaceae bacterium]